MKTLATLALQHSASAPDWSDLIAIIHSEVSADWESGPIAAARALLRESPR